MRQRPHPIIKQVIDRDCHIGERNRAVIKHVISKLRDGYDQFKAMPPEDRRNLMIQCISAHERNRNEYHAVMNCKRRPAGVLPEDMLEAIESSGELTGDQVKVLMRQHSVKIQDLAEKMNVPQKRVREYRSVGLTDNYGIRDVIEGITGCDPGYF